MFENNEILIQEINELKQKINELETKLSDTQEHLKKYTAPKRHKVYYENHKEELLQKMKLTPISSDKRKEYNKNYYLKKK